MSDRLEEMKEGEVCGSMVVGCDVCEATTKIYIKGHIRTLDSLSVVCTDCEREAYGTLVLDFNKLNILHESGNHVIVKLSV